MELWISGNIRNGEREESGNAETERDRETEKKTARETQRERIKLGEVLNLGGVGGNMIKIYCMHL